VGAVWNIASAAASHMKGGNTMLNGGSSPSPPGISRQPSHERVKKHFVDPMETDHVEGCGDPDTTYLSQPEPATPAGESKVLCDELR
jgi:hypothetical protein